MLKKLHNKLAITFTAFLGAVLLVGLLVSLSYTLQRKNAESLRGLSMQTDLISSGVINAQITDHSWRIIEEKPFLYHVEENSGNVTVEVRSDYVAEAEREDIFSDIREKLPAVEGQYADYDMYMYMTSPDIVVSAVADVAAPYDNPAYSAEAAPSAGMVYEEMLPFEDILSTVFLLESGGVKYRVSYVSFQMPINEIYEVMMPNTNMMAEVNATKIYTSEIVVMEDLSGYYREIFLICLLYFGVFIAGLAVLFLGSRFFAKQLLKSTEEGLRREKEFIASAGHELRTPLAVIRASLSAADGCDDEADAKKYRLAADTQAERMGRLIDDLLLASADSASWNLRKAPLDMDTLLIETAEAFTPVAGQKGIELKLNLPQETLPEVNADKDRISQILGILLDNAIDYSPKNSRVELTAQQKKNKIVIEVADEAGGIPEREKDRIFESGQRTETPQSGEEKNAAKKHFGLGLSIAEDLAKMHGGSLTHRNNSVGGSTFTLEIDVK